MHKEAIDKRAKSRPRATVRLARLIGSLAILSALLLACAKDMPPPGGPADITPPDMLASTPLSGATNVSTSDEIVIQFSERLNSKSVPNALFISPPLKQEPRVRVSGSRVRIIPEVPLDSGRTYVVTLGASVSDLNGNRLKNSLTLAFSTGTQVDSGRISGRIFDMDKPAANFRIFAYENIPLIADSLFARTPNYITESGTDGQFTFDFIREGEYLVLGVEDKDRDNLISREVERIAIPTTSVVAVPAELAPNPLALHVSRYDSTTIGLINCSGYAGQVTMMIGGAIDPTSVYRDSIMITTSDSTKYVPDAATVLEREPDRLYIFSTHFGDDSVVSVSARGLVSREGRTIDNANLNCLIRVRGTDTQAPDLVDRLNKGAIATVYPHDSLKVTFTEPVNFQSSAIALTLDSLTTIGASVMPITPLRFAILPDSLVFDRRVIAGINLQSITDLYGNAMKDTTYRFDVLFANPDSLGSVRGSVEYSGDRQITLRFSGVSRKIVYTHAQDRPGPFYMTMYPDRYLVTVFTDENGNGRWDYGKLTPFRYAEPGWTVPDTLRVRARFDTEGFDLDLR